MTTQEAADEEFSKEDTFLMEKAIQENPNLNPEHSNQKQKRSGVLKQKIKFISKILVMQKILREQHETIMKIKTQNNNKLPQGLLSEGRETLDHFLRTAQEDSINERIPY